MSISIDSRYCNWFINLGRPIFPLSHSGASATTVFTIPENIRDRTCAVLHSRWVGRAICNPSRLIATWFSYCSLNPLRPQNCIYLQSDLSCLYKLNCNIFNHHKRFYFSLHLPAPAIRHFFWLAVIAGWWRQAAEPASWLCNDLSIPRAPENMSHKTIITIYFHIWT